MNRWSCQVDNFVCGRAEKQVTNCTFAWIASPLSYSLSLVLLLLQKPPAFWPTGRLFEPFPFNIFLHKVCAWFLFNLFLLRGIHTHTCVNVCIVGCCLPLTGFHLKLAKATCGNCVRLQISLVKVEVAAAAPLPPRRSVQPLSVRQAYPVKDLNL